MFVLAWINRKSLGPIEKRKLCSPEFERDTNTFSRFVEYASESSQLLDRASERWVSVVCIPLKDFVSSTITDVFGLNRRLDRPFGISAIGREFEVVHSLIDGADGSR